MSVSVGSKWKDGMGQKEVEYDSNISLGGGIIDILISTNIGIFGEEEQAIMSLREEKDVPRIEVIDMFVLKENDLHKNTQNEIEYLEGVVVFSAFYKQHHTLYELNHSKDINLSWRYKNRIY